MVAVVCPGLCEVGSSVVADHANGGERSNPPSRRPTDYESRSGANSARPRAPKRANWRAFRVTARPDGTPWTAHLWHQLGTRHTSHHGDDTDGIWGRGVVTRGHSIDSMYPSLGIGAARGTRYPRVWRIPTPRIGPSDTEHSGAPRRHPGAPRALPPRSLGPRRRQQRWRCPGCCVRDRHPEGPRPCSSEPTQGARGGSLEPGPGRPGPGRGHGDTPAMAGGIRLS